MRPACACSAWHRNKHRRGEAKGNDGWRKLHIAVDAHTGLITAAAYGSATQNDCLLLPALLDDIAPPIAAVAADMAYDTVRCRAAIHARGARQLIPPKKTARLVRDSAKLKPFAHVLKPRDEAIQFFRHNAVNGDPSLARAAWKRLTAYHARSRVETVFSQIKAHASDKLTNKTEPNRRTQAILKCVLANILAPI